MGCGNGRDRVLDALNGDGHGDAPVAVFTQSSTLSQMDATGAPWPVAHSDPDAMARLGSAQADMFRFDSVRVPFCVTVEAEALGCKVNMGTRTSSPKVLPGTFTLDPFGGESSDPSDIPSTSEFLGSNRVGVVSDAVSSLSRSHGDHAPVIAGVTCPLTMLSQMVGAENMVVATLSCPGIIRE
ncbi:MAG: uroporphyrinogen decarboxylase family protein, partial [Candidatus Methanomethylophilaceae archaeon]